MLSQGGSFAASLHQNEMGLRSAFHPFSQAPRRSEDSGASEPLLRNLRSSLDGRHLPAVRVPRAGNVSACLLACCWGDLPYLYPRSWQAGLQILLDMQSMPCVLLAQRPGQWRSRQAHLRACLCRAGSAGLAGSSSLRAVMEQAGLDRTPTHPQPPEPGGPRTYFLRSGQHPLVHLALHPPLHGRVRPHHSEPAAQLLFELLLQQDTRTRPSVQATRGRRAPTSCALGSTRWCTWLFTHCCMGG